MQSTVITVVIIFDKVVPEMDFELMLNKFKRFVQANNWNGIPKSSDTVKVRMSGFVIKVVGVNKFVTSSKSSTGGAKRDVICDV